jgi:hypothetical protein
MKRLTIQSRSYHEHDTFHAQQGGLKVRVARFGNLVSIEADGFGETVTLAELAKSIKQLVRRKAAQARIMDGLV